MRDVIAGGSYFSGTDWSFCPLVWEKRKSSTSGDSVSGEDSVVLLVWLLERGRSEDVTLDTHRKRTLDADLRLPLGVPSIVESAEAFSESPP